MGILDEVIGRATSVPPSRTLCESGESSHFPRFSPTRTRTAAHFLGNFEEHWAAGGGSRSATQCDALTQPVIFEQAESRECAWGRLSHLES